MTSVGKGSGQGGPEKVLAPALFFPLGGPGGEQTAKRGKLSRVQGANGKEDRGQTAKGQEGQTGKQPRGAGANGQRGGGEKYSVQRGQKIYPTEAMQSKTTHFNVSK